MGNIFLIIYLIICFLLIIPIRKMSNKDTLIGTISFIDIFGTYNLYLSIFLIFMYFTGDFSYIITVKNINYMIAYMIFFMNLTMSFIYLNYYCKKLKSIKNSFLNEIFIITHAFFFITYPIIFIYLLIKKKSH